MPLYRVTLAESRDKKLRHATAYDEEGMAACSVSRGASEKPILDAKTVTIQAPSGYKACVEMLDGGAQ